MEHKISLSFMLEQSKCFILIDIICYIPFFVFLQSHTYNNNVHISICMGDNHKNQLRLANDRFDWFVYSQNSFCRRGYTFFRWADIRPMRLRYSGDSSNDTPFLTEIFFPLWETVCFIVLLPAWWENEVDTCLSKGQTRPEFERCPHSCIYTWG